jgi:hypothetical protein
MSQTPIKFRRQTYESLLIGLHAMSSTLLKILRDIFQLSSKDTLLLTRSKIQERTRQNAAMKTFQDRLGKTTFLHLAEESVTAYIELIGGSHREDRSIVEVLWDVYSRMIYERPILILGTRVDKMNECTKQWITECTIAPGCQHGVSVTLRDYRAQDAIRRIQPFIHHLLMTIHTLFGPYCVGNTCQTKRCYLLNCYDGQKTTFMSHIPPNLYLFMSDAAHAYESLAEFVPSSSRQNVDWSTILWDQVMRTMYENPSLVDGPDTVDGSMRTKLLECICQCISTGMSTSLVEGLCPTTATSKLYRMQFLLHRIDAAAALILHSARSSQESSDTFCQLLGDPDHGSLVNNITVYTRTYLDYHRMATSLDMSSPHCCSLSEDTVLDNLWKLCRRFINDEPDTQGELNLIRFRECLHDLGPCVASRAYLGDDSSPLKNVNN